MVEVACGILLAAFVLVLLLDALVEYRRTHPRPKPPTPEQRVFEQRRWDEDTQAWRQRLVHRSWDEKLLGDLAWSIRLRNLALAAIQADKATG